MSPPCTEPVQTTRLTARVVVTKSTLDTPRAVREPSPWQDFVLNLCGVGVVGRQAGAVTCGSICLSLQVTPGQTKSLTSS